MSTCPAPTQVLAFLALSVTSSLKITDRGLVDVDRRDVVSLAFEGDEQMVPRACDRTRLTASSSENAGGPRFRGPSKDDDASYTSPWFFHLR